MTISVPKINNQCVCIVDRNQPELAAVISSYFQLSGTYFPVFECPNLTAPYSADEDIMDEHIISRIRGGEFNIMVHNAVLRFGGCEYLLLAGLTAEQKSYLKFSQHYQTIEITDLAAAEKIMPEITASKDIQVLNCRPEQYLEGLMHARKNNAVLQLRADGLPLTPGRNGKDGLIVIEQDRSASVIIGLNYAAAVNADVQLVMALDEEEPTNIREAIEDWQSGNQARYDWLATLVMQRVGHIDFSQYTYATFFTQGLPYSLLLHNSIPFTYVNINLRPDLFIVNNILYSDGAGFDSIVVFSPEFFSDEETTSVIEELAGHQYFVKALLNQEATVRNLDYHLKEYPYNVLHICSHGGEVDGYGVVEIFTDRHGQQHVIEYDEVVGFAPEPGVDLIAVTSKQIFKKLDGLAWRSPELKSAYGHDVFTDMQLAMQKDEKERILNRTPKNYIPSSCAIKCHHSIHQGMFQVLAAHSSPLVFNNTCWSWFQIAESFLYGGARTYIGTLWAIDNQVAANTARNFYHHIFDMPLSAACHEAIKCGSGTSSADIYVFWGLHFSTLKKGISISESRKMVARSLLRSAYLWKKKASNAKSEKTQRLAWDYAKWNESELRNNFTYEDMKDLMAAFLAQNPEARVEVNRRLQALAKQINNK